MRISSGKFRSLKLETLDSDETRPTLAKVKEAIFNMLYSQVENATCLDLFAGSGALGIEALSNGAKFVDFNDSSYHAIKVLKNNISRLKIENYAISKKDYSTYLKTCQNKYDLIFLDPPYHLKLITKLINLILEYNILNENGIIVCEFDSDEKIELENIDKLEIYKDKSYGKTKILMLRGR